MILVSRFLARAWPYIALAGLVFLALFLGRRNGALNEALKAVEAQIDLNERMRDAAAKTRTDKPSVIGRLRDGKY